MISNLDVVELSKALIKCKSVTPKNDGAIEIIEFELSSLGFECFRVDRGGICNLFARLGKRNHVKTFGFNGHTDVVPPGDLNAWTFNPFGGIEKNGSLYGRGAADMKTAIAAFICAVREFVEANTFNGSIVIMITGDEEADATDGTIAILDWMEKNNEHLSVCLVGEPTCPNYMGEMIKIGRRGSVSAEYLLKGVQGHVAYPAKALNPLPYAASLVERVSTCKLDSGTKHFDPSTLAVTSIDTGNNTTNVIPSECRIMMNVRFNEEHSSKSIIRWLEREAQEIESESNIKVKVKFKVSGESFITQPGDFSTLISESINEVTGVQPKLSTSGGTSDARFITSHCPVVEFGLVGSTLHKVDEHVAIEHIDQLKSIYKSVLLNYFS